MAETITGKILILKYKKDIFKVRGGEIVVVNKTTPELTLIINRIKAIITENDNMLCHAAIIAREFNKPILMGYKNAIKKFKNGEKVSIKL